MERKKGPFGATSTSRLPLAGFEQVAVKTNVRSFRDTAERIDLPIAEHPEIIAAIATGLDVSLEDIRLLEMADLRLLMRSVDSGSLSPGTATNLLLLLIDFLQKTKYDELIHELFIWSLQFCPKDTLQKTAQILADNLQDEINSLLFVGICQFDQTYIEKSFELPIDRFISVVDIFVKINQVAAYRSQIIAKLLENPQNLDILCGIAQLNLSEADLKSHGIDVLLDTAFNSSEQHHVCTAARFLATRVRQQHPLSDAMYEFILMKLSDGSALEKGEMVKLLAASLVVISPAQCAALVNGEAIERICEVMGSLESPHTVLCCFQILEHFSKLDHKGVLDHMTPDDLEAIQDIAQNGSEETERRYAATFARSIVGPN
jgi:hypothetical protein